MTETGKQKAALRRRMKMLLAETEHPAGSPDPESPLFSAITGCASVFSFASVNGEPDTAVIAAFALAQGKTLLLPRINGRNLDFLPWNGRPDTLQKNRFGIPEPTGGGVCFPAAHGTPQNIRFPVLVLVPGAAFSRRGERLGRGGGYYDRFLADFARAFPAETFPWKAAGYCFAGQIVGTLPVEAHDRRMDCLFLPDGSMIETENSSTARSSNFYGRNPFGD